MRQENIDFLEANYHHWATLRDAQYLKGLNANEREGMQRVMAEEFVKGYTADLWCPSCCADMVRQLYTRYDTWKTENNTEPIKVKASFPRNNKR